MTRGKGRRPQDKGAFGTVSKLPSGRYRAMYYGPEGSRGRRYSAPTTFTTKRAARKWLATVQADIEREVWLPPTRPGTGAPHTKTLTLAAYAGVWLSQRDLKPRTAELYRQLLDRHILPTELARLPIRSIAADDVRAWFAGLDRSRPTQRAHTYALLRTILSTAAADGKIAANPCVIRGAGSAKRAVMIRPASLDELAKLTAAMPERLQAMVLLASWCALRFGELTELRRRDIDIDEGVVRVRRAVVRTKAAGYVVAGPKSTAGVRDVFIPPHVLPALRDHMVNHVAPGCDSLLFTGAGGGHLASSTLGRYYDRARAAAGRPDLRFHDLRHSGATLAAQSGATLAELMARLGHTSPAAAMRYQHAVTSRDKLVAEALSRLADGEPCP